MSKSLRWRHNGHDSVSNHQPHRCLLNRLFWCRSKTSKFRVTGLCAGNSPGTSEFPAQMASNAENVSIWWRHHVVNNHDYVMAHSTLLTFSEGTSTSRRWFHPQMTSHVELSWWRLQMEAFCTWTRCFIIYCYYLLLCSDMVITQNICWKLSFHIFLKMLKSLLNEWKSSRHSTLLRSKQSIWHYNNPEVFRYINVRWQAIFLQDIDVASKLFYSCCYSFYGWQLWHLSSNYIEDIYVAWQKAIRRIFNLQYNTHRYLLPFVAGSSHIRVNLVNRYNNFFNALMSSDNKIIELLVYNCHFSNTPLGLDTKFMNMYNCYKCNDVEEAQGGTASVIIELSMYKLVCHSVSERWVRIRVRVRKLYSKSDNVNNITLALIWNEC